MGNIMRRGNRYTEAFKEGVNVFSLATVAAVSAAMLNPLPLLVGLVGEAVYLLFVADSKWYDARLSRRYDAQVQARQRKLMAELFPTLHPNMQKRYARLESTRKQLETQDADGQVWFRQILRKLDYLMEKFLIFASNEARFSNYLRSALEEAHGPNRDARKADVRAVDKDAKNPRPQKHPAPPYEVKGQKSPPEQDHSTASCDVQWISETVLQIQQLYDDQLAGLQAVLSVEQDADTRAVLEKRVEILERRKEFAAKMAKIQINLTHQLQLIEDTFGLINDEIRAHSPEQVLNDIESLVDQSEMMTRIIEELSPSEQLLAQIQQTAA